MFQILSLTRTFGMLFFLGFFRIWIISDIDCSTASAFVKTGIGVVLGTKFMASVSTSFMDIGL